MQAIITKYLGPTDTKASRIKATGWRGTITVAYPNDKPHGEQAHRVAVDALIARWFSEDQQDRGEDRPFEIIAAGALPNTNDGYAFVIGYTPMSK